MLLLATGQGPEVTSIPSSECHPSNRAFYIPLGTVHLHRDVSPKPLPSVSSNPSSFRIKKCRQFIELLKRNLHLKIVSPWNKNKPLLSLAWTAGPNTDNGMPQRLAQWCSLPSWQCVPASASSKHSHNSLPRSRKNHSTEEPNRYRKSPEVILPYSAREMIWLQWRLTLFIRANVCIEKPLSWLYSPLLCELKNMISALKMIVLRGPSAALGKTFPDKRGMHQVETGNVIQHTITLTLTHTHTHTQWLLVYTLMSVVRHYRLLTQVPVKSPLKRDINSTQWL